MKHDRSPAASRPVAARASIEVDGRVISVTNADRVVFPGDAITKGEVVEYHRRIAPTMLPHVRGRPLSLHRFRASIADGGFYQQHAPPHFPDWIGRVTVAAREGTVTHVAPEDCATLVYLANQGVLTPHAWPSRREALSHPDEMIFDLDPSEDDFATVREAAHELRAVLEILGLEGRPMTTGSRGIHVIVALDGTADFEEVGTFARDVASVLVARAPAELTVEHRKAKRHGRLLVDVLRNRRGHTSVAPYAVRPREGAPVATPVSWPELDEPGMTAHRHTIRSVLDRLQAGGDPWGSIWGSGASLRAPRERLDDVLESPRRGPGDGSRG
jgi:bifunctional non-homologous end joining protein LigD